MNKSLLLVVDVQNGFVNEQSRHVVKPIKDLVTKWQKERKGPVIYSRFVNLENSPWRRLFNWHKMASEPETSIHPDLPTSDVQIFKKGTYSAWSPEVQLVCLGEHVETVVVCGIDTDQCVMETAIDVFDAGLRPIVAKDCCASAAGPKFHTAGLLLLERLIGTAQVIESSAL